MFIRQLNYLVALAREKHFGRAAQACHVSQPALSGAIRSIEEELGIVIVQRGRRFEGFTQDGERVLAWARRVLADCEGLRQDARADEGDPVGTLRLGVIPAALPLAPLLTQRCLARFPRMRHEIHTLSAQEIQRKLDTFELDLGLSYLDDQPLAACSVRTVFRERYVLVAAGEGSFDGDQPMSWEAAAHLPLCLLAAKMQCRQGIDAMFQRQGLAVEPRVETDSLTALCAHVRHSGLFSILPHSVLCQADGPLAARVLVPELSREMGLLVRDEAVRSPLLAAALRELESLNLQGWADRVLP
ncbi:LysR family transcriptional regulator [Pantoea sp. Tr-811]|uniref:LysR family transcriptional regulator n=1 Tax=Pantoea sp. Tr-811 TaxID=2608361 RepID=UPI00141E3803|nr:LysR family transcriptional regulator [Pantoea sp. Tr-811]NIF27716.1 LysR family transcriptional regulator [Pantoea sp. Tr-811]